MDGEERYDGLLWYRENEEGIACYNADSIRRVVDIGCVGAAVQILHGAMEQVSFSEGTVTLTVEPGEAVVLSVLEDLPLHIYSGGILLDALQSGPLTVRGTGGNRVYAACYEKTGGTEELTAMYICEEGTEISPGDNVYRINLLAWNGMEPVQQKEIKRLTETQK